MFKLKYDDFKINYHKTVLIVIDMIKGFTDIGPLKSEYIKNIANNIETVSHRFNDIIAINDKHNLNDCEFRDYPPHCIENTEECDICDELKNINFTQILFKNSTNGFFSDRFLDIFKEYIDNNFDFVVCGCCTDICIFQFCITFKTYLNSINRDLNIIIPENLVETYDSEIHPRNRVKNSALYFMKNAGIILINTII